MTISEALADFLDSERRKGNEPIWTVQVEHLRALNYPSDEATNAAIVQMAIQAGEKLFAKKEED